MAANLDLLARLDAVLLDVEQQLYSYEKLGPELQEAADEGLALAVRVESRLRQTHVRCSEARQALDHVGIADWDGRSWRPELDPRIADA